MDCPKSVLPPIQPTKSVNDGFQTVNNKKKGKQGVPTDPSQGGFTKPIVGKKFQYQPKKPPSELKKVDVTKKKAADVPSTSGTKVDTSNKFNALSVDDTDDFGIPTKEVNKDVEAGSTMEEKKNESQKTSNTLHEMLVSDSMEVNKVGPTPIVEKIDELEKLLIDGKTTLVDDDGNPIKKIDYPGNKKDSPSTSSTKRVRGLTHSLRCERLLIPTVMKRRL
jgi:hypothetical protein